MSKKASSLVNMLTTLLVVTGVAALSLGFVFDWTKEPIAAAKIAKQMQAVTDVTGEYDNDPLAESYSVFYSEEELQKREGSPREGDYVIYPTKIGEASGVKAIKTYSNNGYSGKIELIVGIDTAGKIKNVVVLDHKETPGLGSKISSIPFIGQFLGKSASTFQFKVKKDGGDVDALSGATISSRAVSEALQSAFEVYNSDEDEKGTDN